MNGKGIKQQEEASSSRRGIRKNRAKLEGRKAA
jgi:hypothetical protein